MHKRTLIQNAIIVNEGKSFKGSVVIQNHHIAEVLEGEDATPLQSADTVVNASGCYLLPGVIDTHVHLREPGYTHKADMHTESAAAAAGGVTTILDMPNNVPQTVTLENLEQKMQIAKHTCMVNYGFYIGATNDNIDLLRKINPRKACAIKVFMGSSTGNMLVDKERALRDIFSIHHLPIVTHCEDTDIIAHNMARHQECYGSDPEVKYHSSIRSREACLESTRLAIHLAKECNTRLHVAHISTADELKLFDTERPHITAEICVPHLVFSEEDYTRLGTRIKCNPSIKTAADREALRGALGEQYVGTIGTDHAPHLLREKVGGAARAVSGMPMVQFSLPAMLELVDQGAMSIERLVELMCHQPAQIFQIENRGFLREGYKADITLVRRDCPWTLTPNRILSKCNWSPMEGHTFRWRVERTYVNGATAYAHGNIAPHEQMGEEITYNR